ncbi:MAG: hypothetical protein ACRD2J_08205 [Thermoanaerobaculia bacterium]
MTRLRRSRPARRADARSRADGSTITIDLAAAKLTIPVDQTLTYERE